MREVIPTLDVLKQIADKRGNSCAAVALNYDTSKGASPLVDTHNVEQASQAIEPLGWRTDEEVSEIDKVSFEENKTRL